MPRGQRGVWGGEVVPVVPADWGEGQGEGFCLERHGNRDVPAQERPEWVLKSPLGHMRSPCRGKGRKGQEGGGGSGARAGRQCVNEQRRERLERRVSVCAGSCFISHVPLSSLKPHPIRDTKRGWGGGGGPGHAPSHPLVRCGHCPPIADKGWILSLAQPLVVPWAGHMAPGRSGVSAGPREGPADRGR